VFANTLTVIFDKLHAKIIRFYDVDFVGRFDAEVNGDLPFFPILWNDAERSRLRPPLVSDICYCHHIIPWRVVEFAYQLTTSSSDFRPVFWKRNP